jgi:hypothetical protein
MDESDVVPAAEDRLDIPVPDESGAQDAGAQADALAPSDEADAAVNEAPAGSADEPGELPADVSTADPETPEAPEAAPVSAPSLDEMLGQLAEAQKADIPAPAGDSEAAAESVAASGGAPTGQSAEATEEAAAETASEGTEEEAIEEVPAEEGASVEPGEVAEEATEPEAEPVPAEPKPITRRLWTRVPLWLLFVAFVVVVGTVTYLLWPLATGQFTTSDLYPLLVFGGAGLVLIDLVTGLAIWLTARSRARDDEKAGLGRTLWMRALAWTAGGVVVWWIGLILLDLRHIGLLG